MDRPEWFLKYLKDAIREKTDFLEKQIQPIVGGHIDAFVGCLIFEV
jgi:hypothetical protein